MAINIFNGDKGSRKPVNTAQNSVRANQAKEALAKPAEVSSSGSTAVAKQGTLSKVGNFIGKAAGVVSKFLPGIGGTIAKGISNIFNDPEWWQSVPGDAVTLNAPLRMLELKNGEWKYRPTILEMQSSLPNIMDSVPYVITPTEQMITQYLLPEVRKVVNAIPLQSATAYKDVLMANATLYAIWRQLLKFDYMLKHGQTYIANMNDPAFPLFQTENSAYLQSLIGRLEEYLRANVRLPHTLCEYLAWRYGRVYKSTNSNKAALVLYNAISMRKSIATGANSYDKIIAYLMSVPSLSTSNQQANADMYNAYYDHDQSVVIADETQFKYDLKEFMLRTNTDFYVPGDEIQDEPNAVYIDSSLDNPTTFMASTVSTVGKEIGSNLPEVLFPVHQAEYYLPVSDILGDSVRFESWSNIFGANTGLLYTRITGSNWGFGVIQSRRTTPSSLSSLSVAMGILTACKALDLYNKDLYVQLYNNEGPIQGQKVDITSLSMDMGLVDDTVIGNEHVYAFANLVHVSRKQSVSYNQAETMVARDAANLVENLDVATRSTNAK